MFRIKFDTKSVSAIALSAIILAGCSTSSAPTSADSGAAEYETAATESDSSDISYADSSGDLSIASAQVSAGYDEAIMADEAATSTEYAGTGNINDAAYATTFFDDYGVNPFVDTEDDNLSTFAMDVDTASYTIARRFVRDGNMPDPASIRTEEFINYFKHDYAPPNDGAFAIHLEGAPSPFGEESHKLLRVGLQGKIIGADERDNVALTFVVDVSGSMDQENRLGLAKRSLNLLVEELRPTDSVAIVVYGSDTRMVLESTMATDANKERIVNAINGLRINGSTNAEAGLRLGYSSAWENFNEQANNRVILVSDGVANVGRTGPDSIWEQIKQYAEKGITMTSVGVGMGNYNDVLMEQLADNGNGNYAYVDNLDEARRIFVVGMTGTLQAIAMDAKIQVEFNAEAVRNYRLIGYENRAVADDDFRNDDEDAGEVGAGHSVTALYEVKLEKDVDPASDARLATVYVRYEDPDVAEIIELNQEFGVNQLQADFATTSPSFQLDATVAEYAEVLKESYWAESTMADVLQMAQTVEELYNPNMVADAELVKAVSEFVELVDKTERMASAQAQH